MDKLDSLLSNAWLNMSWWARHDRALALRRSRRRFMGVLTRPLREWCLIVRASDTRINDFTAMTSKHDMALWRDHQPHGIVLAGELIRRLTQPVRIPWPGVTIHQAERMLGRHKNSLHRWIHKGVFKVDRYPEFKFPSHRKRPYVWSPHALDPNNFHGRAPHAAFGTLWQYLWENMDDAFEMTLRREPRLRKQPTLDGRDAKFVGWEFVCPGRRLADGTRASCGKRCTYLYCPQKVWTLAQAMSGAEGFEMPESDHHPRLAGQWHPGMSDTVALPGTRAFACKSCWGVRSAVMSKSSGWNDLITHISGGLLYGQDVPRPLDEYPMVRRKRPYTRKPKPRAADAAVVMAASA